MNPAAPSPSLREITDKLLDVGTLDDAEVGRLMTHLENDTERDWFLGVVQQEALLEEIFTRGAALRMAEVREIRWPLGRWLPFTAAAVAVVVFGVGLFLGIRAGKGTPERTLASSSETPAAQITGLVGVEWATALQPFHPPGRPPDGLPDLLLGAGAPQRLALKVGLAEITYANGVRVTIQGPCDFSITGSNAARLDHGRMVAFVPPGAEGFNVDYRHGRVVDLGTEFGLEVEDGGSSEVGVFTGEIRLEIPGRQPVSVYANEAVALREVGERSNIHQVPLDRSKFVRRLPTRDFPWEVKGAVPVVFSVDVTHLIWRASDYRAIFKWNAGSGPVEISEVRLLVDGQVASMDQHTGITSFRLGQGLTKVQDNIFSLKVQPELYQRGRWTLEAVLKKRKADGKPALGLVQFEEGFITRAKAEDFVGTWVYTYRGARYERSFYEDGTAGLLRNGAPDKGGFRDARWEVRNGELLLYAKNLTFPERHVLRDKDTLIFVDCPYENARRKAE